MPSYRNLMDYFSNEAEAVKISVGKVPFVSFLESFFELTVRLCPTYCMSSLLEECSTARLALEAELEKEIMSHPELDLAVEPRFLLKSVARDQLYNKGALEHKVKLVILTKTLIAFFDYFDGEYGEAFFKFRWILQFLHEARRIPGRFDLPIVLSLDYERSLSLLCAQSLLKEMHFTHVIKVKKGNDVKMNRLDIFEGLLANILDCTEPSILTCVDELDYYMMDELFRILGEMQKFIAFLKGPLCEIDVDSPFRSYAIRPQRGHVNEMIRKYILASTFKLSGDPSILVCFDGILEGIVLYGGIHLEVISFFHEVKQFYRARLQLEESLREFPAITENPCITLINDIMDDWSQMDGSTEASNIQCPQVLVKVGSDEIVMVDAVYEESGNDHNHDITLLLSAAKLRAKRKIFGKPHLHHQYSTAQWQIGLSWVKFWENCHLDNKGGLPSELNCILGELCDVSKKYLEITPFPKQQRDTITILSGQDS